MLSYKNDTKLKTMFVKEIKWHREQDKIVQGTYGEGSNGDWKGCAVGCSIHSLNRKLGTDYETNDHTVYEKELGIPEWLARLEDTIFEGLPVEEAKKWPEQFAQSIPVGVDLNLIKYKFCSFILKENIDRVLSLQIDDELKKQVVKAIRQVLAVYEKTIETGTWDKEAAESAESAAWSAAASAARSAAESAESAESAARSAASAARSAAESAVSAARSAESATYQRYAKELLRLIKSCK